MPDTSRVSSGPTQNYGDPALDRWQPRPVLAWVVKAAVYLLPPLIAIGLGWLAAMLVPASRLGMNPWLWLACEVALSTALVLLVSRLTRRLLPLSALLTMALVFPDQAPSRLSVAVRTHSPAALRRRVEQVQSGPRAPGGEAAHASELLGLVAALSMHDHATRGHSERVQGYAALIARQMNLSEQDAARLRWAALLHDIGKLRVPAGILNKKGRPTDAEWEVLTTHPHAGLDLVAPLADYLGDWVDAISQHHERWDGKGYPLGLSGMEIHRGARIIAVADTYDVITSTRSYKEAMPASQARAELARCAGTQFDPQVVRAFLEVGLGKLRLNAGPLSALTSLPGFRAVPLPDVGGAAAGVGSLLSTGSAATTAALGLLVGAVAAPAVAETAPPPAAADLVQAPAEQAPGTTAEPTRTPSPTDLPKAGPSATPSAEPTPTPEPTPSTEPTPTPSPTPAPTTPAPANPAPANPSPANPSLPPAAANGGGGDRHGGTPDCTKVTKDELGSCPLAGATLTGDWSHADLSGQDLHGAVLSAADFDHATFAGANLQGAIGLGASFDHADFSGANLSGASITLASLGRADFSDANLSGASLSGTSLVDAVFDRAQIDGLKLSATNLTKASFVGATGTPTGTALAGFNRTVCPNGTSQNTSCW